MELKKEELEIKRETIAAKERIAQIQADMLAKQAGAQHKRIAKSFVSKHNHNSTTVYR